MCERNHRRKVCALCAHWCLGGWGTRDWAASQLSELNSLRVDVFHVVMRELIEVLRVPERRVEREEYVKRLDAGLVNRDVE